MVGTLLSYNSNMGLRLLGLFSSKSSAKTQCACVKRCDLPRKQSFGDFLIIVLSTSCEVWFCMSFVFCFFFWCLHMMLSPYTDLLQRSLSQMHSLQWKFPWSLLRSIFGTEKQHCESYLDCMVLGVLQPGRIGLSLTQDVIWKIE